MIFPWRRWLGCFLPLGAAVACVAAQDKPLIQTFTLGRQDIYRVDVMIRSELRGVATEQIGAKSYVKPFVHAAEATLRWAATRKIAGVDTQGIAVVEESIDLPSGDCPSQVAQEESSARLREALAKLCESWKTLRVLRYREGSGGFIRDYPKEATPDFAESDFPLLAYWSRHAWRPTAIFPMEPLRPGQRYQHAIPPNNQPWSNKGGSESAEWLPAAGESPALVLHVTQELSGEGAGAVEAEDRTMHARRLQQVFFAESLSTLSLLDGSLIEATRSAKRETTWTLDPVEGLPDAPKFSSRLSVTVAIHRQQ